MNLPGMTEAAPGWGNLQASIFFVGQSLCTLCMQTQIPFTKGSGYLIDAALYVVGLERKDIFISNVVHCHPPHNRTSEDYEIRYCKQFLIDEIELIKPKLIIVLGSDAKRVLEGIEKICNTTTTGKRAPDGPTRKEKIKYLYVKHPAYLLRKGGHGSKDWVIRVATYMEKVLRPHR